MTVCRFFQQGSCRYGQNCRYDHIYGSKYSYHAPSNQTNQTQQVPAQNEVADAQLVAPVQNDVQAVLVGNQWILSSYSPFKEKANFPGLTDLSMEEARLFIYEAKDKNNLDQAVSFMNNLIKETRQKYEQLLQPNAAIIKILRSLYKGEPVSASFENSAQSSGFGGNSAATSIFRSATQSSSIFGQSSTNNTPSVFSQTPVNTNTSVFAPSVFGQSSNTSNAQSIFNQNTNFGGSSDNTAKSIFSQATQNVFGQSQAPANVFANNQPSNIFGNANTDTSAKSVFATANQNMFGPSQPQPKQESVFGPQSVFASSPFSNQQNSSPFASQHENTSSFSNTASGIFGAVAMQDDVTVYSDIKDISPSDIKAFESEDFKLGFIPEIAPPLSLCM